MLSPIVCSFTAALFLSSAWTKARSPNQFLALLKSYPLPEVLKTKFSAYCVIVFEVAVGVALLNLSGFRALIGLSIGLSFLLLATAFIAVRWTKGERRFRCGCGGNLDDEEDAAQLLVRNISLIGLFLIGLNYLSWERLGWSAETLSFYLIGGGLLAAAKLGQAIWKAVGLIRIWKAAG